MCIVEKQRKTSCYFWESEISEANIKSYKVVNLRIEKMESLNNASKSDPFYVLKKLFLNL